MTREEELDWLCRLRSEIYVYMPKEWLIPMNNALEMAIKALEQEPKWDRLYSWLNDMRLGIAPDETTPDDERRERQAQVDLLDDIMEWMVEPQEGESE